MPLASGARSRAAATCSGPGGWLKWCPASHRGDTQTGSMPAMISPTITDLCAFRETSSFPCGPATAGIADFTDSELPHVEKKVCSAWTASAIRRWACSSTPWPIRWSSRPFMARMSEAKTPSPSTSTTLGSAPAPCLWPGGVNDRVPRRWYADRASSTGAWAWSMGCGSPPGLARCPETIG